MSAVFHEAVLVEEVIKFLNPGSGHVIVDGTLGGGGHAEAVLSWAGPGGEGIKLAIGLDQDPEALAEAEKRLRGFGSRAALKRGSWEDLPKMLTEEGIARADGILLDLGVSRHQLTSAHRGMSLKADGPLDMRMDPELGESAADLLERLSERELADLLWNFGEERSSRKIARAIVSRREQGRPVKSTRELRDLVESIVHSRNPGADHPAARTFMALRIAVNGELDRLERALAAIPDFLAPAGRAVIISYHSLEDRLVKTAFQREARGCECPPEFPRCVCGKKPRLRVLTRHPVQPSADEIARNPAARSAKLRAAERLEDRP